MICDLIRVATEEAYFETLIDRFGTDPEDFDDAPKSPPTDSESDQSSMTLDRTNKTEKTKSPQSNDSNKVRQLGSGQDSVTPAAPRKVPNRDVYYDITRSKLTSKYPPSRPSALSSLLATGVRRVSPPATATEIAADQSAKTYPTVYDITRASLGTANPYTNVTPMKNPRQLPKGLQKSQDGFSSDVNDKVSKTSALEFSETDPTVKRRVVSEKSEEVARWLLSYLPRLQQQDVQAYVKCLISDGFDSYEILKELGDDDIQFMKKGHKRVLSRKLEVERKLDLELDQSSRKRIEMLVGASSRKTSGGAKEVGISGEFPNVVSIQVQSSGGHESAGNKQQPKTESSESTPLLAYDIFEAGEQMKEEKAWIEEQNALVEKRRLARSSPQAELPSASLNATPKVSNTTESSSGRYKSSTPSAYGIIEADKELEDTEAWIDEQNHLIEKRRAARSKSSTPLAYNIIESGKERKEAEAWIDEQDRLIEERQTARSTSITHPSAYDITAAEKEAEKQRNARSTPTSQLPDEVSKVVLPATHGILNATSFAASSKAEFRSKSNSQPKSLQVTDSLDRSAWYEEQNRLVEERRISRMKEEQRRREMKD